VAGGLLTITGGHRFDEQAMADMVGDVCLRLGWEHTHAVQPDAQRWLRPEHAGTWDAILLHDIPGLSLARGRAPEANHPSDDIRRAVLGLLELGQGIVATHHALAGWPTWDDWADVLGGRFLYAPGRLHDVDVPASGYRMATYRLEVAAPDHPVCAGIEPFELDDELYLCPVFEDRVAALLTTPAEVSAGSMIDTYREVLDGERLPAPAQTGSRLVAWARQFGASRIVYVLPGHSAGTMAHEQYRRLIANACRWVAESTSPPVRR
jgi:type 1 glutamine amidotransferase